MKFSRLKISDVVLIEPSVHNDHRGFFFESFNEGKFFDTTQIVPKFVQNNHSISVKNALHGLHYQIKQTQAKLVRVVVGEVFDVAVDIRKSSATFGCWIGERLSAENKHQLWIPEGFAHGFVVISESAEFLYQTTNYWAPAYERCIAWDDPAIGIKWPLNTPPILSDKDKKGLLLANAEVFP